MLRNVQAAGKSLYVSAPPADVDAILAGLSPSGLMISVEGVFESLEEGERFVAGVGRICVGRVWGFSPTPALTVDCPGQFGWLLADRLAAPQLTGLMRLGSYPLVGMRHLLVWLGGTP